MEKLKLVQTEEHSIIYGDFHGEYQELFRCPRSLDNLDLREYVNKNRIVLGWEPDVGTVSLHEHENYIGYFRMYFRDGSWYGRWMDYLHIDNIADYGVGKIIAWLKETFPNGCDYTMKKYLENYPTWKGENRYLLKPIMSDKYKVMFDTTYGNHDYPVRIYAYK